MDYLTREDAKALISELLNEGLGQLETSLSRQLQVQQQTIEGKLAESTTNSMQWLDQLVEEAESVGEEADDAEEFDYDSDDDVASNPVLTQMQRQMAELKANNDRLNENLTKEQQQRAQMEQQKRLDLMQSAAVNDLAAHGVVNPKQMVTLLLNEGRLVEEGDRYVIKASDKHGELKVPLTDAVGNLLTADYAHFAASRPGTGAGTTLGGSSKLPAGSGFKYFDGDGKPKVDPGEAIASDRAGYMQELAAMQKG